MPSDIVGLVFIVGFICVIAGYKLAGGFFDFMIPCLGGIAIGMLFQQGLVSVFKWGQEKAPQVPDKINKGMERNMNGPVDLDSGKVVIYVRRS